MGEDGRANILKLGLVAGLFVFFGVGCTNVANKATVMVSPTPMPRVEFACGKFEEIRKLFVSVDVEMVARDLREKENAGWRVSTFCLQQFNELYSRALIALSAPASASKLLGQQAVFLPSQRNGPLRRDVATQNIVPSTILTINSLGFWESGQIGVKFSEPLGLYGSGDFAELSNLRRSFDPTTGDQAVLADTGAGDLGYFWLATIIFKPETGLVQAQFCEISVDIESDRGHGNLEEKKNCRTIK